MKPVCTCQLSHVFIAQPATNFAAKPKRKARGLREPPSRADGQTTREMLRSKQDPRVTTALAHHHKVRVHRPLFATRFIRQRKRPRLAWHVAQPANKIRPRHFFTGVRIQYP